MAKISAGGAHKVVEVRTTFTYSGDVGEEATGEAHFALRSDGVILRKIRSGGKWTGYSRWKVFTRGVPADAKGALERAVSNYGYQVKG